MKEHLRLDRENMARDVDSEDDSEWLDDPIAVGLQPLNAAAAALPGIERFDSQPNHTSCDKQK